MVRVSRIAVLAPIANALSNNPDVPNVPTKRVAIIGAGAGGASAAYHLAQYAAESSIPVNITVFERNAYIGGRTTTVNAWDDASSPIELGGSIFVSVNHILVSAMKTFNLSAADETVSTRLELPDLGIWDGEKFVLVTRQEDGWWEKAKLIWRYGSAPFWTNRLMKKAVGRFLSMYEEPIFPWKNLSEAVESVGLLEATGVTGTQYLKANGVMGDFASEVVQASTRVNYASNLDFIHGLETMVCMATSGAMSISGGNWRIFAHMLNSSSAITTHLSTPVVSISKLADQTYNLTSLSPTKHTTHETYDTIILASPLQFSSLIISPPPAHTPDTIPYKTLHTTLFASPLRLSPAYFNLPPNTPVPQHILTTLSKPEIPSDDVDSDIGYKYYNSAGSPGFYSISLVDYLLHPRNKNTTKANGAAKPQMEYIYKIFSPYRITPTFLSQILAQNISQPQEGEGEIVDDKIISWLHHKKWFAYPREYPRVTFEETQLDADFWYTSGIEGLISTMETSALSGRNVARGVRDGWLFGGDRDGKDVGGERGEKGEEVMEL